MNLSKEGIRHKVTDVLLHLSVFAVVQIWLEILNKVGAAVGVFIGHVEGGKDIVDLIKQFTQVVVVAYSTVGHVECFLGLSAHLTLSKG
jgi:hypothetical protein